MESGFLHMLEKMIGYELECFYPCFNGIRVLTTLEADYLALGHTVSILVLMESGFLQ